MFTIFGKLPFRDWLKSPLWFVSIPPRCCCQLISRAKKFFPAQAIISKGLHHQEKISFILYSFLHFSFLPTMAPNHKEILKDQIGWKDEWKKDPKNVVRVQSVNLVTVQVVFALISTLGSCDELLLKHLNFLVPVDFNIPFTLPKFKTFLKNIKKHKQQLNKTAKKREKELPDFLASCFFNFKHKQLFCKVNRSLASPKVRLCLTCKEQGRPRKFKGKRLRFVIRKAPTPKMN